MSDPASVLDLRDAPHVRRCAHGARAGLRARVAAARARRRGGARADRRPLPAGGGPSARAGAGQERAGLSRAARRAPDPSPAGAGAARVVLAANAADVRMPAGTRVAAPPPPGSSAQIAYETERSTGIAAAKLADVFEPLARARPVHRPQRRPRRRARVQRLPGACAGQHAARALHRPRPPARPRRPERGHRRLRVDDAQQRRSRHPLGVLGRKGLAPVQGHAAGMQQRPGQSARQHERPAHERRLPPGGRLCPDGEDDGRRRRGVLDPRAPGGDAPGRPGARAARGGEHPPEHGGHALLRGDLERHQASREAVERHGRHAHGARAGRRWHPPARHRRGRARDVEGGRQRQRRRRRARRPHQGAQHRRRQLRRLRPARGRHPGWHRGGRAGVHTRHGRARPRRRRRRGGRRHQAVLPARSSAAAGQRLLLLPRRGLRQAGRAAARLRAAQLDVAGRAAGHRAARRAARARAQLGVLERPLLGVAAHGHVRPH